MKVLFLTSSLGCYDKITIGDETIKQVKKCDNTNHFIDRLKSYSKKLNNVVFLASNPDDREKSIGYSGLTIQSLNLDDFEIKNASIIDHNFDGNIKDAILSADCVILMGGNVPTQNRYFKEIGLKEILEQYSGIVIGQSAGSMNCSKIVYTQPEKDEEFEDDTYQRQISGLGLVNFPIMPHINDANEVDELGHQTVMQMCLEDSYTIPHYGIVDYGFIEVVNGKATAYGETFYISNGKCVKICDNGETLDLNEEVLFSNFELNK